MREYPVQVELFAYSRKAKLLEDFEIVGFTIPAGYISDGATIPRPFWSFAHPFGSSLPAALLHDYLLSDTSMPRRDCDRWFLYALKESTPYKLKPYLLYAAVRLFSICKGDKR